MNAARDRERTPASLNREQSAWLMQNDFVYLKQGQSSHRFSNHIYIHTSIDNMHTGIIVATVFTPLSLLPTKQPLSHLMSCT